MTRRTPPERVVVSLCVYENGASRAFHESVNHVVSSAMSPYGSESSGRRWTPPERVVMSLYGSGSCGSRRTLERIVMSAYGGGISGSHQTLAERHLFAWLQHKRAVMRPYVRGIWSSIYSFAKQSFAEQKCEAQWTAHAGFGMSTCGSSVSYDANSVHLHAASCAGANHPYAHAMHYIPSSSVSSLSSSGLNYPHRGGWYQNRFVLRYVRHNRLDGWYAFEDLWKAHPELTFLEIQKKAYADHSARELAHARDWFYSFARRRALHPIMPFLRMPVGQVRHAGELWMHVHQLCHAGVPAGAELVHHFQRYKPADEVGAVQRVFNTADISRATKYHAWCHLYWALPLVICMKKIHLE